MTAANRRAPGFVIAARRRFAWLAALAGIVAMPASAIIVPDPAFGTDGVARVTGFDGLGSTTVHLAVATDGALVFAIVGRRLADGASTLVVGKLQTDGALDSTFGGGIASVPIDDPARSHLLSRLLTLDDGGALVFVHLRRESGASDALLLRFGADGRPSRNFNDGQPLSFALPTTSDAWTAHAHSDGFLVASVPWIGPFYTLGSLTHGSARFLRVTADGRVDTDFGLVGVVELPDLPGRYGDALLLPDGGFQVLHTAARPDGRAANRWRRYRADGAVDSGNSSGWHDVGDDGSWHLVHVFPLAHGRHAVVDAQSMFAGFVDGAGRMTSPTNVLHGTRTVQPFGDGRALVGINRDSGFVPTPYDGAFAAAVDATGAPDGSFVAPGQPALLRLSARVNRHNFVADSPSTFVVADYNQWDGLRVLRYLEIRGDGGPRSIPATSAPALLLIVATVLLAGLVRLRREDRFPT